MGMNISAYVSPIERRDKLIVELQDTVNKLQNEIPDLKKEKVKVVDIISKNLKLIESKIQSFIDVGGNEDVDMLASIYAGLAVPENISVNDTKKQRSKSR